MSKFSVLFTAFALSLCSYSKSYAVSSEYVIGQPRSGPFAELGVLILTEAYQRIGMRVQFTLLPGKRSLISASSGKIDADMFRVDNLNRKHPNLVKVPESFIEARQTAFSKQLSIVIAGWESLRPYQIIYRRGHIAISQNTEDQGMAVYVVSDNEHLFQMLQLDRGDIGVDELFMGLSVIRKLGLHEIRPLSPPLSIDPLYHYVNKRHITLVPKLTKAIREMKEDNTIDKLFEQTLSRFE